MKSTPRHAGRRPILSKLPLRNIWTELPDVQIGRISFEGKIHEQLGAMKRKTKRILDVVGLNQATLKNRYLKL